MTALPVRLPDPVAEPEQGLKTNEKVKVLPESDPVAVPSPGKAAVKLQAF